MTTARLDSPVADAVAKKDARGNGRRTLLLLAFICILPVLASYFMFYVWPPQGRVNHGDLVTPTPLPATVLPGAGGQGDLRSEELEGRWTLLFVGPAACTEACARAAYVSRQVRIAQAKEMARVGRVWLLEDAADPQVSVLERQADLRLARADAAWLAALPSAAPGSVWLIDPLGNVMMHFADDVDTTAAARAMSKDLQRLLKYSALGRGGRE
ncbi:hypothetical protein [Azoarcus sp. L1K30]|uniref:hypothetical protein n=1 Tax=Azoarcus sp. L1K30 TaxID=2820277 RepID=UPI002011C8CD|nr:hypothetical protein [Azoarcus sp. L1K30]